MYIAELKGKLSSRISSKEDVLTSNVFSFFKYSDRKYFLWRFLRKLGFEVTKSDVLETKFIFWPKYDDDIDMTQPWYKILRKYQEQKHPPDRDYMSFFEWLEKNYKSPEGN